MSTGNTPSSGTSGGNVLGAVTDVPADVVATAATEIKNVLDVAKTTVDNAEGLADAEVDALTKAIETAYQQALHLLGASGRPTGT